MVSDQSIGVAAFASGRVIGVGASYVHARKLAQAQREYNRLAKIKWHYKILVKITNNKSDT